MPAMQINGRRFDSHCDLIDVTSASRPDENWEYVDPNGHLHRWEWPDGRRVYQPDKQASLPTLQWVVDGKAFYPDGEEYEIGHYACLQCGSHVRPRNKADDHTQYVPGLRHFSIDGRSVSREEFERELKAEGINI